MNDRACPCDPERRYSECCQPYHEGMAAPNAEVLMRSRYSAYVLRLTDYLLRTWHPPTRLADIHLLKKMPQPEWLGLIVMRHAQIDPDHATVEFTVHYRAGGRHFHMHEVSRFVREDGVWSYLDGSFPEQDARD